MDAMTRRKIREAELMAATSSKYARAMERTDRRTNGRRGSRNAPVKYAAYLVAEARYLERADKLRQGTA